ncbi:hypothetical protein DSECCO2_449610 [anaerobic digester metagenome]
MTCPKCKSENCSVQIVEVGKKTKNRGTTGVRKLNRTFLQVCTFGMYGLFIRKKTGSETTKTKNQKRGLCQDCGHDWKL